MDLLGDVLAGLRLESTVFCFGELSAPWGFAKDALMGSPFHAVTEGEAFVTLSGETESRKLIEGDLIVLPRGDAHTLACAPESQVTSFTQILANRGAELWQPGQRCGGPVHLVHGGGGNITRLISGVFAFKDMRRNPLIDALPKVMHISARAERPAVWLESTLTYLAREAETGLPGAAAVTARLADVLFIQAVRTYLAEENEITVGWLRGLRDPAVSKALALIHSSPEKRWTVASLAEEVGASRSRFASRFIELVGLGPIAYLTNWRMHLAGDQITGRRGSIAELAEKAGYRSEVAFSKAFKRWSGLPPATYGRKNRGA